MRHVTSCVRRRVAAGQQAGTGGILQLLASILPIPSQIPSVPSVPRLWAQFTDPEPTAEKRHGRVKDERNDALHSKLVRRWTLPCIMIIWITQQPTPNTCAARATLTRTETHGHAHVRLRANSRANTHGSRHDTSKRTQKRGRHSDSRSVQVRAADQVCDRHSWQQVTDRCSCVMKCAREACAMTRRV